MLYVCYKGEYYFNLIYFILFIHLFFRLDYILFQKRFDVQESKNVSHKKCIKNKK